MKIAVVESPYRATSAFELARNLSYARDLCAFMTSIGYSPNASHLLLTQFLDDRDPEQRRQGIEAGLAMRRVADLHVFGIDLGYSSGMEDALEIAKSDNRPWREVSLPQWASTVASGNPSELIALIATHQPKWHVHGAISI